MAVSAIKGVGNNWIDISSLVTVNSSAVSGIELVSAMYRPAGDARVVNIIVKNANGFAKNTEYSTCIDLPSFLSIGNTRITTFGIMGDNIEYPMYYHPKGVCFVSYSGTGITIRNYTLTSDEAKICNITLVV